MLDAHHVPLAAKAGSPAVVSETYSFVRQRSVGRAVPRSLDFWGHPLSHQLISAQQLSLRTRIRMTDASAPTPRSEPGRR